MKSSIAFILPMTTSTICSFQSTKVRSFTVLPQMPALVETRPKLAHLWRSGWLLFAFVLAHSLLVGCGGQPASRQQGPAASKRSERTSATEPEPIFIDATKEAGIRFTHNNGASGQLYLPEIMGAGTALLDYDHDGDLDVYLVQGGELSREGQDPQKTPLELKDRLYRNDLIIQEDGSRTLGFTDVTIQAFINAPGYGMGVATGDYNNDGWVDLYVTNYGANQLWKNNRDGTFSDVAQQAGVRVEAWSTSAAWVDYDRDGWLDLFVCNYVDFNFNNHKACYDKNSGALGYCSPTAYPAVVDRLLHNNRDGTFTDVSAASGIARHFGAALGVICSDLNRDGWVDIYVANDATANLYWVNQKNGRFENQALLNGCAFNHSGVAEGSMGVDAGDFDGDGDEDLFMTHIAAETNTLYVNDGRGVFEDTTSRARLSVPSRELTGFGTAWFDYDNDGWLDLFVANGDVFQTKVKDQLQQNQLFRNQGNGVFQEVTGHAGSVLDLLEVSRGAAFGDIDNDGDTDILVTNNAGPCRLLLNQVDSRNSWLGIRLLGSHSRREETNARVEVLRSDGTSLWRRAHTDGSYCSANDPRILVGLGADTKVAAVRVHWPTGDVEQWTQLEINQYVDLRQGTGKPSGR